MQKVNSATKSRLIAYPQAPFLQIRQTLHSDRAYESHAHTTLSIGYIVEGKTRFQTPRGTFLLEHGGLALIEPHVQHACNPYEEACRSYVMVYVDPAFCAELLGCQALGRFTSSLVLNKALFDTFFQTIEALIQGYDAKHITTLQTWLKMFLTLYLTPSLPPSPSCMQEVAWFLEHRFDEPLSLHDLAHRFSQNPFVLVRRFKARYGCTPKHYWLDMRIHHAKTLLQQGVSLALCAQYCGFVDQSHFHRFFKRRTALSPKEYQVNFIQ